MFSLYGVWIDIIFQLQNYFFGGGEDLGTIAHKVAMDQGFFSPLFDVPIIHMSLLYIDCSLGYANYSFCKQFLLEVERRGLWTLHGILSDWWLPAILTTWLVWVPSLFVVYSLPSALQFIMFSIITTFWTMIQLFIEEDAKDDSPVEENRMNGYQVTPPRANDETFDLNSNPNVTSRPIVNYSTFKFNDYSSADNQMTEKSIASR